MQPAPEDWQRLEDLLDTLLDLPERERAAFLGEMTRESPGDAAILRGWLAGIDRSEGYLASTRPDASIHRGGELIGNWRVSRLIGRGGMGEVWLGERADGLFEKRVAIKFIRDDRPQLARSIESERRVLAALQHPGIVRLLDAGTTSDGHPFLVTDFIDGVALDHWIERERPDLARRLRLFRRIAEAVAYAHERLVIHRDIKPANILVDADAHAHLLDFGIARALAHETDAAQPTQLALTPDFAAPEVVADNSASVRSDIYALGALLYFMLCGKPPLDLRGLALAAMIERIRDAQAPRPSEVVGAAAFADAPKRLLVDLDAIALKTLSKTPADRYGTVDALLADLDAAREHRPISARAPDAWDRARRAWRRHRVAVTAAALLALSLLAGMAGTLWQAHEARLQGRRAELAAARALTEAKTANAVRDFLIGVFKAANPEETAGTPPTAVELVDAAVREADNGLHDQPELQSQLFAALGATYMGLGRYDQAKALLGKGRKIAAGSRGADSLQAKKLAIDFARAVGSSEGPYDEARALLGGIVAADSHATPEDAALTVAALTELGGMQRRVGELDAAEANLRRAVSEARELNEPDGEHLAAALHQLAGWAADKGRRLEAVDLLREIIAIQQRDPDHFEGRVNALRTELATELGVIGRNDEAESILRQVVDGNRRIYGAEHPAYLGSVIELGRALVRKPAVDEAEALLDEALATSRRRFGNDNELTAHALISLAAVKYSKDDFTGAIALAEESSRYVTAHDGPYSARALLMLQNLARMRADKGDYAQAERELHEVLEGLARIHSDKASDALELLGDLRRYQGDAAAARAYHQQALDALRRNDDATSFDVQEVYLDLAQDERNLGNLREARRLAETGLAGLVDLDQDANSRMIDVARYIIGQIDVLEGRCASSLPAIETLHERFKDHSPHPMVLWKTAQIGLFLGMCRRQLDRDDAAAQALVAESAGTLRRSTLADPWLKRLAADALRGNRR